MERKEKFYNTLQELASDVAAFEEGTLSRSRWHHRTHLAVAFWYLSHLEESQARLRICRGIRHYNDCQGIPNTPESGYHETLTVFWIRVIRKFLDIARPGQPRLELFDRLIERYGNQKDFWRDHYSFDLLKSAEARRTWVEPDRKDLNLEGPL
jgi:hypothetical protein